MLPGPGEAAPVWSWNESSREHAAGDDGCAAGTREDSPTSERQPARRVYDTCRTHGARQSRFHRENIQPSTLSHHRLAAFDITGIDVYDWGGGKCTQNLKWGTLIQIVPPNFVIHHIIIVYIRLLMTIDRTQLADKKRYGPNMLYWGYI